MVLKQIIQKSLGLNYYLKMEDHGCESKVGRIDWNRKGFVPLSFLFVH